MILVQIDDFILQKNKYDGNIIGFITLRHWLNNKLLKYGGHIEYSIRPTERRKGYGSEMLGLALDEFRNRRLDRVLVTCRKENIGSSKVILNNGGIFKMKFTSKKEEIHFIGIGLILLIK